MDPQQPGRAGHALVVGESLIDIVRGVDGTTRERPGGSAANVAVALARLGRPVRMLTSLGSDARGGVLAAHLGEAGVELVGDPVRLARTSTASATIGADGAASYEFDIAWPRCEVELGGEEPLFVHVGSLGAVLLPGADAVRELVVEVRGSAWVSYDLNVRPDVTGVSPELLARVEEMAQLADLVKASDEDLQALYPALDLESAARRLRGLGPAVVVTRGSAGLFTLTEAGPVEVPAPVVRVADTIGAGDTVSAALIDAMWPAEGGVPRWEDVDLLAVLTHAARAAAVTTSRVGADPPYRAELGG